MKGKLIILVLILLVLYLLPTYPEPRVMKNFISEAERRHIISEASKTLETLRSERAVRAATSVTV